MERTLKNRKSYFMYDFAKVTGGIPALLYYRPRFLYPEGKTGLPKGGCIIVSNHNSFSNPVVLLTSFWRRRLFFMATTELMNNAPGRFVFRHFHCIPVDKENFNMDTWYGISGCVTSGKVAVIFPEGFVDTDRGENDEINPLKEGAVLMAMKTGAPLVPVYIAPRKSWLCRQRVVVGKPMELEGGKFSISLVKDYTERLYNEMSSLRQYYWESCKKGERI